MDNSYITLARIGEGTYEEKKSVFIGVAYPIETEEDALEVIRAHKKKYYDARHNCYAYILGDGVTQRFSDDGEPQGSAGLPMLNVLSKKGLCGACVVVTRYFGGTLLGVGGLVRAYTQATVDAVADAGIKRYEKFRDVSVRLSYSDYQKLGKLMSQFTVIDETTDFTDSVTVSFSVLTEETDKLVSVLTENGNGRWAVELLDERWGFRSVE